MMKAICGSTSLHPECEVVTEGGDNLTALSRKCAKNPDHEHFIPVHDFNETYLPEHWRESHMGLIRDVCNRTIRLEVRYTSTERPDTFLDTKKPFPYSNLKGKKRVARHGTGVLTEVEYTSGPAGTIEKDQPCVCPECENFETPMPKYWMLIVATAAHVVFDDSEAEKTVGACFYDNKDKQGVKYIYGVQTVGNFQRDAMLVMCVTHDQELIDTLLSSYVSQNGFQNKFCYETPEKTFGLMVSHPHGLSKKISVGHVYHSTMGLDTERFPLGIPHQFGKDTICRIPQISKEGPKLREFLQQLDDSLVLEGEDNVFPVLESLKVPGFDSNPNQDFTLPEGTTFTLTEESKYFARVGYQELKDSDSFIPYRSGYYDLWVSFPPGTSFKLPNGKELRLPSDVKFHWDEMSEYVKKTAGYTSYDICTCPGSSGARILCVDNGEFNFTPYFHTHCGSQDDGSNRSTLVDFHTKKRFFEISWATKPPLPPRMLLGENPNTSRDNRHVPSEDSSTTTGTGCVDYCCNLL